MAFSAVDSGFKIFRHCA